MCRQIQHFGSLVRRQAVKLTTCLQNWMLGLECDMDFHNVFFQSVCIVFFVCSLFNLDQKDFGGALKFSVLLLVPCLIAVKSCQRIRRAGDVEMLWPVTFEFAVREYPIVADMIFRWHPGKESLDSKPQSESQPHEFDSEESTLEMDGFESQKETSQSHPHVCGISAVIGFDAAMAAASNDKL